MKNNRRRKTIVKRVVSLATVFALSLGVLPMPEILEEIQDKIINSNYVIKASAASPDISDITSLQSYATGYTSANKSDEITIMCTQELVVPSDFIGIGTSDAPFEGTIRIANAGVDDGGDSTNLVLNAPLFNYISDKAKILNASNQNVTIFLTPGADNSKTTLFANHVAGMGGTANWKIRVNGANARGSLIGEIYNKTANPNVSVECYNESATISNGSEDPDEKCNLGMICNTLNAGSLSVSLTNGLEAPSILTTNGNVGRLVGEMATGTTLNLKSSINLSSSSTIQTGAGYAGGLVGKCCGTVSFDSGVSYSDNTLNTSTNIGSYIIGTNGAGGAYGYYETSDDITFDISKYTITTALSTAAETRKAIKSDVCVGGLIGELVNNGTAKTIEINGTSASTDGINSIVALSGQYGGGIVGYYKSASLSNTLEIDNLCAKSYGSVITATTGYYGGLVGKVDSTGSVGAYVNIHDVKIWANAEEPYTGRTTTNQSGGLIGYTENNFIDISGSIDLIIDNGINPTIHTGLIYESKSGVVRLAGTTDLTNCTEDKTSTLLVSKRGNTLIYALGTGSDSGWTYKRPNISSKQKDDVNDWGQVVRLISTTANGENNTNLETAGVVAVSSSNHTVTLSAATTEMSTTADFAKTALNIKLNTESKDFGALKFTTGDANKSSTLLGSSSTISLSESIDLSGTGLTGLTRDDGSNVAFTGTFNGNNKTITLATGEAYGYKGTNAATTGTNFESTGVSTNNLTGAIASHKYNGLFAKAGTCTIRDLIIAGKIVTYSVSADGAKIGGAVAEVTKGNAIFNNVDCKEQIYLYDNDKPKYVGFLAGIVTDETATTSLTVTSCDLLTDATAWINRNNARIGLLGEVSDKSINISMSNIDLKGTINYKGDGRPYSGGLIGKTSGGNLTLTDIDVNGLNVKTNMTGNSDADKRLSNPAGGLLGGQWLDTNVFFGNSTAADAIKVTDGTLTLTGNSSYAGGLVADATGYWQVNDIDITSMSVSGASNGLGLLVLNGKNGNNGLYLEITSPTAYTINTTSVLASGASAPSVAYDEIMAFSKSVNSSFEPSEANGQAIVSIHTTNNKLSMTSGSDNSYSPSTTLGSNHNPYTRYYYNLDYLLKNASTEGEKMLLWSVNQYACANIKNNAKIKSERTKGFSDYSSLPTSGSTVDFQYLSYYPVDIGTLSIPSLTVKFHNAEMQAAHGDNYDLNSLDTNSKISQHYLMHAGLFKNVSGGLTVTNMTLQGDVSAHAAYASVEAGSGAIVCGKIEGSTADSKASLTINGLSLDGIKVNGTSGIDALIVKRISNNTNINIKNVSTTSSYNSASATNTAAKYLMGEAEGTAMSIVFEKMILDGRTTADSLYNPSAGSDTDAGKLNTAYHTFSSIFSDATFLKSLKYATGTGSSAKYDYTYAEDWGTTKHQVTYAKEISASTENVNEQLKYVDHATNDYYTSPVSSSAASPYSFTNFIPHVAQAYNLSENYHEVAVNIVSSDLDTGCGTYNDPYYVDGTQLKVIADALSNKSFSANFTLSIDNDYTTSRDINFEKWCTNKTGHTVFKYNGTKFAEYNDETEAYVSGGKTLEVTEVLNYLAGAYYYVDESTSLPSTYGGLGGNTAATAFRGVIVGASGVTITNASDSPLIKVSNGSVVKNLTVNVTASTINKTADSAGSTGKFGYDTTTQYYGGIIGEIMGGDNIIDNVRVTYSNSTSITVGGTAEYNVPMGAYIGVVVNGSVIFRNMTSTTTNSETGESTTTVFANTASTNFHVSKSGATNLETDVSVSADGTETFKNLYVNPIIGRVINGFAIYETNTYRYSEDGYYVDKNSSDRSAARADSDHQTTLKNGRKNFSIPDFNAASGHSVLTFSKSTSSVDYNDTITVNNAQDLYVMSLICQTNMGSAQSDGGDYKTSYDSGYDSASTNYKATHLALYDKVGPLATSNTDADFVKTKKEKANSKTQAPYLIYEYTTNDKTNDKYPARTLNYSSRQYTINLNGTNTTFYLPDSFRGIGSLAGQNLIAKEAKIGYITLNGFNGNGNTIDVNTYFRTNSCSMDNYFCTATLFGIALFNSAASNGLTVTNGVPNKAIFDNFNLSGYISAKRANDAATSFDVLGDETGSYWNVGGILSYESTANSYSIENVDFNNLVIDSNQNAGAIISRFVGDTSASICINNCNADKLSVSGHKSIGGLIGLAGSKLNIYLNLKSNTYGCYKVFVHQKYKASSAGNSGGLFANIGSQGYFYAKNADIIGWNGSFNTNSTKAPTIGRYIDETTNETINVAGNGRDTALNSAGLIASIGYAKNNKDYRVIHNINVYGVNINGYNAGGIIAEDGEPYNMSLAINISNCGLHGKSDDRIEIPEGNYMLRGHIIAGGIVGKSWGAVYNNAASEVIQTFSLCGETFRKEITGCLVNDYTIQTFTNASASTGGLIGEGKNRKLVSNSKVDTCTLICDGNNNDRTKASSMGGIIGGHAKYYFYGYNLTVNNLTFKTSNGNNERYGLIGCKSYQDGANVTFKIIGFTASGNNIVECDFGSVYTGTRNVEFLIGRPNNSSTATTVDFSTTDKFDTSSYIIRADHNAISNTENKGTKLSDVKASGVTNVSMRSITTTGTGSSARKTYGTEVATETETTVNDNFPYVTSSPKAALGNSFLTGDGVAIGRVQEIIDAKNDASTPLSKKYSNITATDIAIWNKLVEDGKISTYNTEMGSNVLPTDIPIIIMDDSAYTFEITVGSTTTTRNWTDAVYAIARILSNTNYTYAYNTNTKIYNVDVLKCVYSGGALTTSSSGTTVVRGTDAAGSITMTGSSFDSNTPGQFTVIDFKYYDPTSDGSKVAYHLYIPVYTKKTFDFKFDITAVSGTQYYKPSYTSGTHFQGLDNTSPLVSTRHEAVNTVAENYGSPVTMFIRYEYNLDDIIADILGGGYGLGWNYGKELNITYSYPKDGHLPNGTRFVLIDTNKNDQANYSDGFTPTDKAGLSINGQVFPAYTVDGKSIPAYSVVTFEQLLAAKGVTLRATKLETDEAIDAASVVFHAENAVANKASQFSALGVTAGKKLVPATDGDIAAKTELYVVTAEGGTGVGNNMVYEDYYLTIYAPADENDIRHQISVLSRKTLTSADSVDRIRASYKDKKDDSVNLMFANLFTKDIKINTIENDEALNILMGTEKNTINVRSVSSISFNTLALGEQLGDTILFIRGRNVKLYQSTLLQLIKSENNTQKSVAVDGVRFALSSPPTESGALRNYKQNSGIYVKKQTGDTSATVYYSDNTETDDEYIRLINCSESNDFEGSRITNFYEIINKNNGNKIDLIPYLLGNTENGLNNSVHEVEIVSNFVMDFDETGIEEQFPIRDTENDGTSVWGQVSLAYKEDATTYSNTKSDLEESIPNNRKYYRNNTSRAKLNYNVITSQSLSETNNDVKTNAVLGINPLDKVGMTSSSINTRGDYNASSLIGADNATRVTWTLSLYRRETAGVGSEYGTALPVGNYLENIKIFGINADATKGTEVTWTPSEDGKILTCTDLRSKFEDISDSADPLNPTKSNRFIVFVDYDVKTGTPFESSEYFYSNYKVVLTAQLVGDDNSSAKDFIKYTNARLDPSYIEAS